MILRFACPLAEHDDGYAENAACDSMSDAAATFTLAPKKQDDLHGMSETNFCYDPRKISLFVLLLCKGIY